MKTTCPRCGQPATVTYSARGTERVHTHKRADGERCVAPTDPVERAELALARRQRELAESKAALDAAFRDGRDLDVMMGRTSVQEAECAVWDAESTLKRERRRRVS